MLSYRHAFHAGNHADILKHISLMLVLEAMCKKEKPFTAIDCNAGAGFYYLDDECSLKTGEATDGILKLTERWKECRQKGDMTESALDRYINLVMPYVKDGKYPGSPEIIRTFLRGDGTRPPASQDFADRAVLMELHNTEIDILKSRIIDSRISIHHRDCYEGLKALTPPEVRRGFLLMDPSYEVASDYTNVASVLTGTQKRWNVGVQLLWYPLLHHRTSELEQMLDSIQAAAERKGLETFTQELILHPMEKTEFMEKTEGESGREIRGEIRGKIGRETDSLNEDDVERCGDETNKGYGLYGSGMLFVNPPYRLQEELASAIEEVTAIFSASE